MKFTVGDAIDQSNCENANKDTTKAVLVRAGDPCLKTSPTHNQCATESSSITETTSSAGALVEVILGGMPDGKYPITVASEGLMSDTFHLYTNSFGNCDGESFPDHRLILRHVYAADQYGHNIDAGAVGSSIPIMARIYHLREGEIEIRNKPTACDGDTVYCDVLVGDRNYSINTDFVEPTTLSFTGPTGTPLVTNLGNGVYTANYTLAKGENQININSRATIELQLSYPILSCKDCGKSDDDIIHNGEIVIDTNTTMKVYGVDITIPPKLLVLVDGRLYHG